MNCSLQIAGGALWTTLKVKNFKEASHGMASTILGDLSPGT